MAFGNNNALRTSSFSQKPLHAGAPMSGQGPTMQNFGQRPMGINNQLRSGQPNMMHALSNQLNQQMQSGPLQYNPSYSGGFVARHPDPNRSHISPHYFGAANRANQQSYLNHMQQSRAPTNPAASYGYGGYQGALMRHLQDNPGFEVRGVNTGPPESPYAQPTGGSSLGSTYRNLLGNYGIDSSGMSMDQMRQAAQQANQMEDAQRRAMTLQGRVPHPITSQPVSPGNSGYNSTPGFVNYGNPITGTVDQRFIGGQNPMTGYNLQDNIDRANFFEQNPDFQFTYGSEMPQTVANEQRMRRTRRGGIPAARYAPGTSNEYMASHPDAFRRNQLADLLG